MNISLKALVVICAGLATLGYTLGRYIVPPEVVIKTETVENRTVDRDKHKETVTETKKSPDGTTTTITRTVEDSSIKIADKKETKSETSIKNNKDWNISALVSPVNRDPMMPTGSLSYGIHIQRKVLGSISVGVFGMTNRDYGMSIGIEF